MVKLPSLPTIDYPQYLQLSTAEIHQRLLGFAPCLRVAAANGDTFSLRVASQCPDLYQVTVTCETAVTDIDAEEHPLGAPQRTTVCFEWKGVKDLDAIVRQFNTLLENAHYDG